MLFKKPVYFIKNLSGSISGKDGRKTSSDVHLREAMHWLLRAQKMTSDGGVSEGFHMYHGWLASYPETSGYIIETFFDYADVSGDATFEEQAKNMAEWLYQIQNNDGSIPDSSFKKNLVFDTGQVLFGFVRAFQETGENKYKNAAIKAGNWLVDIQERDGSWIKHAVHNIPHTYYSRVAWSLLKLYEVKPDDKYIDSCIKNIEWCLKQQEDNGWFNSASFTLKKHRNPFTHTIVYTIRGILEAGICLEEPKYIDAAVKAVDNLLSQISPNGFLAGTYDKEWKGNNGFSCLTGNAQLAIVLIKLSQLKKSKIYLNEGIKLNNYLKSKQNMSSNNLNIKGAIPGSYPVWGKYIHFTYPNWAAKFFVDALLLEKQLRGAV